MPYPDIQSATLKEYQAFFFPSNILIQPGHAITTWSKAQVGDLNDSFTTARIE